MIPHIQKRRDESNLCGSFQRSYLFFTQWMCVFVCFFVCSFSFALSPEETIKNNTQNILNELKIKKNELKKNPRIIDQMIESILLPHIDINRMAGMTVGRAAWYDAETAERKKFVSLFQKIIIKTYSSTLSSYNEQDSVVVDAARSEPMGQMATVHSTILRANGQKISVTYEVIFEKQQWKVYDFSVEGVSLVSNYRSQFAETLANGGLKKLNLELKNR